MHAARQQRLCQYSLRLRMHAAVVERPEQRHGRSSYLILNLGPAAVQAARQQRQCIFSLRLILLAAVDERHRHYLDRDRQVEVMAGGLHDIGRRSSCSVCISARNAYKLSTPVI